VSGLAVVCVVRSGEVVFEINVAFVAENLKALLRIGPVASLDFAVQSRCAALYGGMLEA